ncbi:MAG: hypothetical protein QOJ86_5429 [Bradyrhizobium sp.]|jgi:uncharacterized membrane protein|nr:hypothetical protein [Bradyrhizobium sp.]
MSIKRIGKHLLEHRWRVRRVFPKHVLASIERAIKASEATHSGQIRFVVEGALDGAPLLRDQSARDRALDVFSHLRIWDTAHNNGVLIYLLLADRDVEILADRGIDAKVDAAEWEKICRAMEADFGKGNFQAGVLKGIEAVSRHLAKHFPKRGAGTNELPDAPVVM